MIISLGKRKLIAVFFRFVPCMLSVVVCLFVLSLGVFDNLRSLIVAHTVFYLIITKTRLYSFDPLKPHFYTGKLGFTGVYIIFLISAKKHRLWVLVRTASPRRF